MPQPLSVKVSSRHQVTIPSLCRQELKIQAGDHLLVDAQDGFLLMLSQPEDYVARLAGLHGELWEGVNTTAYLHGERGLWNELSSG